MRLLIGIDDTDNLESRGTGHRARQLGLLLQENGLAVLKGITRHQLLVSPEIPYTSHNSSACLEVEIDPEKLSRVREVCRDFLLDDSALGSDAGLCVLPREQVSESVRNFGKRAKCEVLKKEEAEQLAKQEQIFLEGLTGTGGGIIGSLAGVGLRAAGNDGRFLWLKGIREIEGCNSVDNILALTGIEELRTEDGTVLLSGQMVMLNNWTRPILKDNKAVLLCEEVNDDEQYKWRVLPKESIKQYSQ